MQSDQIWGLQQLKKSLKGLEKEEFVDLESSLLDLLHRQRLYPNNRALDRERDEIIQKLEVLSQNSLHKSFAALCIIPNAVTSISDSAPSSEPFFDSLGKRNELLAIPKVNVKLLTEFIPIAFSYQKNVEEYPLITLHIDNTQLQSTFIANVKASFDGYSEPAECQIKILPGSQQTVTLLPLIGKERMKAIREQCPVMLRIEIQYLFPFSMLWPYTRQVYFLPRNAALLWRCQEDGTFIDCTQYLAAWVTPHHPQIDQLICNASEYHPEKSFQGYNVSGTREEKLQKTCEQVKAIFDVLHHKVKVKYISSSEIVQSKKDSNIQKVQFVRLPVEVIDAGGSANCIDATLLFASLLANVNLQPLIFLQPGHALIGWHVFKDDPVYEFLETTMINTGDFHRALERGQEQYEQASSRGALGRTIIDLHDYAFLIDIADCRRENIQPMDW